MGNPSHWMSNRTRYTCCHPGRVGADGPGRTHNRVRNLSIRTIRSASRRRDAREDGPGRTHTRVRSL